MLLHRSVSLLFVLHSIGISGKEHDKEDNTLELKS